MMWLAALQRYALPLGIVLAIAAGYAYHRVELRHARVAGYEAAEADMAARVTKANAATAALEQRQREQSQKASQAWESERNELQGQVVNLLARGVTVRVCKPAASGGQLPGDGYSTASFDGTAWVDDAPLRSGPDIGPALAVYGGKCEEYARQLSALQEWFKGVAK